MKILELFGGIGACSKALEKLGVDYEIADYVEIDKYAVASFNAIHNTNFEPQDITTWDKDIKVDLIMHGSPCQDFSLAGKQAGGDEGSGTRSSLMYETIRIVQKLLPKYVIWENVKNLLSKKHRHNFDEYLKVMEQLGYVNYYQVLNAKDYGIPQNRERVFTVSIRAEYIFKEGIDFKFPEKQKLELKLKDMLENNVDDKYYLSDNMIKYISANNEKWTGNNKEALVNKTIASTINTNEGSRRCDASNYIGDDFEENYNLKNIITLGNYSPSNYSASRVVDTNGLAPTVMENYGTITAIPELKSNCKRLKKLIENTNFEEGKVLNMDLYNQTTNESLSQTLTEPHHNTQRLFDGLRIRKLTPKECWRLMGFEDSDFDKASKVCSNTQLYKQAGNSIVVNVLEAIFKNLL